MATAILSTPAGDADAKLGALAGRLAQGTEAYKFLKDKGYNYGDCVSALTEPGGLATVEAMMLHVKMQNQSLLNSEASPSWVPPSDLVEKWRL